MPDCSSSSTREPRPAKTLSRNNSDSASLSRTFPSQQGSLRTPTLSRFPSFNKRHASFYSPREVPLPSPSLLQAEITHSHLFGSSPRPHIGARSRSQENKISSLAALPSRRHHRSPSESVSPFPRNPTEQSGEHKRRPPSPQPLTQSGLESPRQRQNRSNPSPTSASDPFPSTSLQKSSDTISAHGIEFPSSGSISTDTANDHLSSSSHPIRSTTWTDRLSSASLPLPSQIPFYALPNVESALGSESRTGDGGPCMQDDGPKESTTACSRSRLDMSCPTIDESSSQSSAGSSSVSSLFSSSDSVPSSSSSGGTTSSSICGKETLSDTAGTSQTAPDSECASHLTTSSSLNRPESRPIFPFRAPLVPQPAHNMTSQPTAMRQSLPSSSSSFPAPEPPVILPIDDENDATSHSPNRARAAYEPFLNRAPPPADSWIEVETTISEYRLNVRLPGFSREGITLATKRRRILHVVADRWDHGGGHFERRISFGYDADLVQVRAEFDGEMLRIVIPRRASPILWSSSRTGYSGRA